jgi:predicted dehydrogenase
VSVVGVGVLGLGQGRSHARAFQTLDRSRVVAVCDVDREAAEHVAKELDVPRIYAAVEHLLADPTVELVVVATPDHLHGRHAIAALEAGKHVLSEIPMATTIEECARIVDLTRRTGLKYHMGNQVRYAHCLQDARRLIADGAFGEVFYGEGEYLHDMGDILHGRPEPNWRIAPSQPQTTLLGGGPHALDTLRWLMGVEFASAQAYHVGQPSRWGTTHTTVALLRSEGGAVAKVTVSYGMARPYCLYYSVYGSEGSFERSRDQGDPGGETVNYYAHDRLSGTRHMIPVRLPAFSNPRLARRAGAAGFGHGTMELEQAMDLLAAIGTDRTPAIGPSEAAASIVPLICALDSAANGGGGVPIPSLG